MAVGEGLVVAAAGCDMSAENRPERWVLRTTDQGFPTAAEWNAFVRELAESVHLTDKARLDQLVQDIATLKREGRLP